MKKISCNAVLPLTPPLLAILLGVSLPSSGRAEPATKVWEQTLILPTYKAAPPDPDPRFYNGRTYQGAKATFYPYPVSDQMTEVRQNEPYKAVFLENDFIRISVLPQLGGRIFSALDKSDGYNFFYRHHVIKPALIGMLGAWISGGVEWNVPHHHRATSFMPVDYTIQTNANGAKTVWVGETELRHRTKWIVGLTLRPNRSYIEMTMRLFNRTPEAQSFLFWINAAVHADKNYQVIFPPSVEWAAQHAKPQFAGWPIAHEVYGGTDYTCGVDVSWWKNNPSPVSFFAWDCQQDFFGGYDYGKQAGVVQISNHHVSPGKKFFEWGNGPEGEMWTKILSDSDRPYLELMAGSYSDNQPDYSWYGPGEVKVFKHYWYPIRDLGGIKNANTEGAVNLDVSNGVARVAFNTTAIHPKARVLLRAGRRRLLDKVISISPQAPFVTTVALPQGVRFADLQTALLDEDGKSLISFRPVPRANSHIPTPVQRPPAPRDITSNEELYLTGLRIEQLYSPSFDPVAYYKEALRRDPGDYRANTALGSLYCRQGRFEEAEPFLRAAVKRATENYIHPKDCEALYYLGVALRGQGKRQAAWDAFYRAIWSQAWQEAGYYQLAELASLSGDYGRALGLVEQSLQSGALNTKALELKASLLRRTGRLAAAARLNRRILNIDPLDARAVFEQSLVLARQGEESEAERARMLRLMRGEVHSYLEMAIDYADCGLFDEGIQLLNTFVRQAPDKNRIDPQVFYFLGYFHDQMNQPAEAMDDFKTAAKMPPDFCFPFQFEAERIFHHALKRNPSDARAWYYLGNLLFDNQPAKALAAWGQAVRLDDRFALAQRNLGLAKARVQKDLVGGIKCLGKAVALSPDDPRLYYELDVLYESNGASVQRRLEALNRRPEIVAERDDALTRRIMVLTAAGHPEEALRILRSHHFHNWEGSGSLHGLYVDACVQSGLAKLRAQLPAEALADFRLATQYPANQEVGRPRQEGRLAEIQYWSGVAEERLGQNTQAQAAFKLASEASGYGGSDGQYYRGLALQKLGKNGDAKQIFERLEQRGLAELGKGASEPVDYFAKFGQRRVERLRKADAHFLAGLGCLGLGQKEAARDQFRRALELNPAHLGALTWNSL